MPHSRRRRAETINHDRWARTVSAQLPFASHGAAARVYFKSPLVKPPHRVCVQRLLEMVGVPTRAGIHRRSRSAARIDGSRQGPYRAVYSGHDSAPQRRHSLVERHEFTARDGEADIRCPGMLLMMLLTHRRASSATCGALKSRNAGSSTHLGVNRPASADDVRHESRHDAALAFEHADDRGFGDFAGGTPARSER